MSEVFSIRVSRTFHVTAENRHEAVQDVRDRWGLHEMEWEIEDRDTPNLDAMEEDDLKEFLAKLPVSVNHLLRNYAEHKIIAIELRAIGNIAEAIANETICERIYKQLPPEAKW
jgi:hypothetical protein